MERFNSTIGTIWALLCLTAMGVVTYALWDVDVLWGVGAAVVFFGVAWHWWQDGGIHQGDELDDTSLPYDEKVKTRFWATILYIVTLPLRFIVQIINVFH